MENRKTVHPLYFHEDGTSALKAEVADTSCELIGLPGNCNYTKPKMTEEELQKEYDFYMAEKLVDSMRTAGIISLEEYTQIKEENRKHFSPYLAELA